MKIPDGPGFRAIHHGSRSRKGLGASRDDAHPRLGIDEKSFRKGHDYITVFTDVDGFNVHDAQLCVV